MANESTDSHPSIVSKNTLIHTYIPYYYVVKIRWLLVQPIILDRKVHSPSPKRNRNIHVVERYTTINKRKLCALHLIHTLQSSVVSVCCSVHRHLKQGDLAFGETNFGLVKYFDETDFGLVQKSKSGNRQISVKGVKAK